ncbi:type IV pilin protein [Beduini massiliensis]|uniref:type IV pilin protein n=1 Tax=Beduini massiliensis TaxID=1585974 RepID=UPI00059A833F|nr:type II secretion system protein [Beduini massiliensis]
MLNKIKQLKKNKKGFTLIELVVVLVIIAILAAITVPVVTGYIEDANNARYVSEARSIYLVVQAEEAKATAKGTPITDYSTLVSVANDKVEATATNGSTITVTSIGYDTTANKYTVVFTSNSKTITAEIDPNNEIKITNKA